MAKERVHNLKETASPFQAKGIVTGVKSKRFYQSGTSKSGNAWNSIEFGLKINENKVIYMKLRGYVRDEVFYYKKSEKKGEKGDTKRVPWKNRKNSPGEGYRMMGINLTVDRDGERNVNEVMTEYDAIEHIHDNWKDGMPVFVKGNMVFSSFTGKDGNAKRSIELVPNQISFMGDIDFDAENFTEMAEFKNTFVYSDIDKETDENGKATGRFILSGYSIGYNTIENVSFIIDENHAKVAQAIKKKMKPGNSIATYGRISVVNSVETTEVEDDGWGSTETSPMERVSAPTKREYIVYKVDPETFDKETYTEEGIAAALKKIKAAKNAEQKFVVEDNDANDWGDDDEEDEDAPW